MVSFNTDIFFIDISGQVRTLNNSLTLRPSSSGNVIIGTSGSAVVPEFTNHQFLGLDYLRWGNIFATSGNFTNRFTVNNTHVKLSTDPGGSTLFVDERAVSGNIIPDTSGVYDLGSGTLNFRTLYSQSGVFSDRIQLGQKLSNPQSADNGQIWYKNTTDLAAYYPTLQYQTPSGVRTPKTIEGISHYYISEDPGQFSTFITASFVAYKFYHIVIQDSRYFYFDGSVDPSNVHILISGLYSINYGVVQAKATNTGAAVVEFRLIVNDDATQFFEQSVSYARTNNNSTGDRASVDHTCQCILKAGQRISLVGRIVSGAGTSVMQPGGSITFEFIKPFDNINQMPSGVY